MLVRRVLIFDMSHTALPTPSLRLPLTARVTIGLMVAALASGCGKSDSVAATQPVAAASAESVARASSAASPAAPKASLATPAKASLPADVAAFRARRDACDHFRGEEPYDAKRAAFLAAEIAKACTGTDRELADLRKRHAGDAAAMDVLNGYEDDIE